MEKGYLGLEGCLKYIIDISSDYDGCGDNIKELHELIDEIVKEANKCLKYKNNYYVPLYSGKEIDMILKDK